MTTKLHPAVEALSLPQVPWKPGTAKYGGSILLLSANGKEVADFAMYGDGHRGQNGGRDPREIEDTSHLVATSPEMLSWMVEALAFVGWTAEEVIAHNKKGRDIIRRASNGKINL